MTNEEAAEEAAWQWNIHIIRYIFVFRVLYIREIYYICSKYWLTFGRFTVLLTIWALLAISFNNRVIFKFSGHKWNINMKQIDSELNNVTTRLINKYNLIFISCIVYIRCFVRFVNPTILDSLSDVLIYETV